MPKMPNKGWNWLDRLTSHGKLRTRLLCIYFLLILLPLGAFSLYTNFRVRRVVQQQTLAAAQNAFDDTFLAVERVWTQLDGVIDILATDPLIYAAASNDPGDFTTIKRLQDSDQLALTFEQLRILSGVDRIQLYVNNDYSYANDLNNIIQVSEVGQSQWVLQASGESGRCWFAPCDFADQPSGGQGWFSSVQTIYNPRSIHEPLAMVRADVQNDRLQLLLNGSSVTENGLLLIMRGQEILLASDSAQKIPDLGQLAQALGASRPQAWDTAESGGTDYYVQRRALNARGWEIACILPARDIYRPGNQLSAEMLLIAAVVTVIAYLLAYALSSATLDRLSLLTRTMQTVQHGDTAVRLAPAGDDEIAQLIGSFNQMMDQIDTLMEEKLAQGQQIKSLELRALQAQINPHFLYNSLDLVNCTAISHNIPEISRVVNALSKFYRISLSKGREVIPLRDELKHAGLYLQIQNMRFDDRIRVQWDLDPAADDCQVIKIILQPIIENAVIHGLFETPSKAGTISITTRRAGDALRIIIQDDGAGMDEETLRANFTASAPGTLSDTTGGYGVRNIHDRIKLAYGDAYGLLCESTPGAGTTVTVCLPAIDPKAQ